MPTDNHEDSHMQQRLSDRILYALDLALDQGDLAVSGLLWQALELSMTRNAGGKNFVERRTFHQEVERTMNRLRELRKKSS